MDLVLGFNIKDNCNYLLSLDNSVSNQKLYKQFIFLLHKDYKSIETISNEDFKIIKRTIDYFDKKDELYLLSRFSEYVNVNYSDKDESVIKSLFLNVIRNSLELEGLLKYIFNIIKLNIGHFNKEISIEVIYSIINYFKSNNIYGIDHFSLFLSILLFKDLVTVEEFKSLFAQDMVLIFEKFRHEEFFVKFKFAQQTVYKRDNEIIIYGHFQNKFKIKINDEYIDFLLQVLESSSSPSNYKESLYILTTIAYKLQSKYYDQLLNYLYNENSALSYKNQKLFKLYFNFKPLSSTIIEPVKEANISQSLEYTKLASTTTKEDQAFESKLNEIDIAGGNQDNILQYFIKSLLKFNKFNFGYYSILISSINDRKIYEFGKFFSLLFKHLELQVVLQLFQFCLNEFFFSTIKNVYKLCLINWGDDNFRKILTSEKFLDSEFDSIIPDIYKFCIEALKLSNLEKNLPFIFYGSKENFKVKYELIEKNYVNQLITILDIHLINKYLLPNFKDKCLNSDIYQFKSQQQIQDVIIDNHISNNNSSSNSNSNSSSSGGCILPNYLILNLFHLYINSTDIDLKSKLKLLYLNHKYFESVVNIINYSTTIPVTIKYTNSIKRLKLIGSNSNNIRDSSSNNWSILKFDKIEYLKVLVLKEGEYIDFKNFKIFSNLKIIHVVMENVVSFLSAGLIKRLALIPLLEKIIFTIGLSRITKDILKDFIYLAESLDKKIEFDINETFTMNDEFISLDKLSNAHKNIKVTRISTTLPSFLSKYTESYSNATDNFTIEIPQSLYQGESYSRNDDTKSILKNDQQKLTLKKIKYLHFKMHSTDIPAILQLLEHMDSLVSLRFTFFTTSKFDLQESIEKIFTSIKNIQNLTSLTLTDDRNYSLDINWLHLNLNFNSNNFKYFFK